MFATPDQPTVATHWGIYRARRTDGDVTALEGYEHDPDPSAIGAGNAMLAAQGAACRILQPMVRRSFLERGSAAGGAGRGAEPFVAVDWDEATDLVARELERVRRTYGNTAIYGGSYGWASAGRFHHAQSQLRRFLNGIGGFVRSVQNYSFAAGDVILPHVIGTTRGLVNGHTPWTQLAGYCDLVVMFGGTPHRNAQVNSGGIARHGLRDGLRACRAAGAEFVNIGPIRDDTLEEFGAQWLALRPNTDTALMLAIAHTLLTEQLHDSAFLARYTTGFERFADDVLGRLDGVAKSPEWAEAITGLSAESIRDLARRMARQRTFIMVAWSLQRADHGEQPYWMAVTLAALLGRIGLPGGGFGFGYASAGAIGMASHSFAWPSLPQGTNAVTDFIPVARIADMLLHPGESYDYNGAHRRYPHVRLIYWSGGNPFHRHQDLNRLRQAWRMPEVVVVHEPWWNALSRHADIVLPTATQLERNDIVCSGRDLFVATSHRLFPPRGESRTDFEIFSALAEHLGTAPAFTEDRSEESWLRHLYGIARQRAASAGFTLPDFDDFWREGVVELPEPDGQEALLAAFRADPERNPLRTPSGRIEIFSQTIAQFGYPDCPPQPTWLEPAEWLGAPAALRYPLHLLSNQPATKLHSQYDHGPHSRSAKIAGREPIRLHPADATARGIADGELVRVFNDRGAVLAGVVISESIRPGVVQMATGAWYDPEDPAAAAPLDKHGNPNVLTPDHGTSRLAQGPSPNSCLVEVEIWRGDPPPVTAFDPPAIVARPRPAAARR